MKRFLTLCQFELKKILNHKKALLFLLALNVIPIIASIGLIVAYIKYRGLGLGDLPYPMLYTAVKNTFALHFKLFAFVAPFFMSLIVGDSLSSEFSRGHMKTLLLTPVHRWQVITAKTIAIMFFLVIAVFIGGLLIQCDLFIAKMLTEKGVQALFDSSQPATFVGAWSATQLLLLAFFGNLATIGFFVLFSLFFESAVLMSFTAIIVLMLIHSFYYLANNILATLDIWYEKAAEWCFTRHMDNLFSFDNIKGILEGSKSIFDSGILQSSMASLGWAAVFFALALFIFSKKQILH